MMNLDWISVNFFTKVFYDIVEGKAKVNTLWSGAALPEQLCL